MTPQANIVFESALARIEASFSIASRYDLHKRRVRAIMRAGVYNPEALRYKRVVEQAPANIKLEAAVVISERCYRMEVWRRERIEWIWGFCHEPRLKVMILDELRLMLRWCRRYGRCGWPEFVEWRDRLNGE